MARLLEAAGQTEAAAKLYETDLPGPYRHGNLLRAAWLRKLAESAEQKSANSE